MQRNDTIVPRLSRGAGDGVNKMCAMQVVSWQNGDAKITDYPECSARALASLVQMCNDELAGTDGYLSPENSVVVLDLGWRTVGTADVPDAVIHAWMAEVLANPEWGVIRYAEADGVEAIRQIADMHRKVAAGEMESAWSAAESAAWSAAWSTDRLAAESAAESAAWSAARSAAWSAAWSGAQAANSAALVEFTDRAITCWRNLAVLDTPVDLSGRDVDYTLERIG